jgi:cyclin-dependent kinase-like
MIEVFRRKRRFYLVFEYVDHTILDELEENNSGLGEETSRKYIFQVLRGIDFCHANSVSYRHLRKIFSPSQNTQLNLFVSDRRDQACI